MHEIRFLLFSLIWSVAMASIRSSAEDAGWDMCLPQLPAGRHPGGEQAQMLESLPCRRGTGADV